MLTGFNFSKIARGHRIISESKDVSQTRETGNTTSPCWSKDPVTRPCSPALALGSFFTNCSAS